MLLGLCPTSLLWKWARLAQKIWVFFTNAPPFDWNKYKTMTEAVQLQQWEPGSPYSHRTRKRRQSVKLQQYKERLNMHNTKTIKCISAASALAASKLQPGPALMCQHLPHSSLGHQCWHRKMNTNSAQGRAMLCLFPTPEEQLLPLASARIKALNIRKTVEEGTVLGYHVTLRKMEVGKKVVTTHYWCLLHDT